MIKTVNDADTHLRQGICGYDMKLLISNISGEYLKITPLFVSFMPYVIRNLCGVQSVSWK